MPIRSMTATISAVVISGAMTLSAQTPSPQTPAPNPQTTQQQPRTQQPQSDQQRTATDTQARGNAGERVLTLTGCLQAEKDVPGRRESMTERAGMGEDYILTNVKMGQGSSTSAIGLASMYQIKGISDTELKKHINHQVEVMGRVTAPASTTTPSSTADKDKDLQELQASSIKMLAATCTAGQ